MKHLVYYTPHKLYSYRNIASTDQVQVSFSQMFNPCISIIDRTCSVNCPPVPIKNLYPMITDSIPDTFESLCHKRMNEIFNNAISNNKKLILFYSGGIDSTLIVVLALLNANFNTYKDHIFIAYSEESITENPVFWESYILPNFKTNIYNSSGFYTFLTNDNNICVTGEFADNIFGSLTLKNYMDITGDMNLIHKPFKETGKLWLLSKILNPSNKDSCSDILDTIINTSNRQLISNHDCFWWLNFILKWQAVDFRLVSHSPNPEFTNKMIKNTIHFFNTTEFQNWAINTSEDKVKDDWYSYKLPAKQIIFDYNKDDYYFKWKTKYPSIPGLTRYTNMYDFIYFNDETNEYTVSKEFE